jgi:hypothetical protein
MAADKIIELRKILAERFPHDSVPVSSLLPMGLDYLDQLTGGGLPRGSVTQLAVPGTSSGGALILHEIINALHRAGLFVALVDAHDSFEPVDPIETLLWIRCRDAAQAVKATDLLLRDGNLSLTILDLKLSRNLGKLPATTWYRFQRLSEERRSTLLIMTRHIISGASMLTIQLYSELCVDDLSKATPEIISSLNLEVVRRKNRVYRAYA